MTKVHPYTLVYMDCRMFDWHHLPVVGGIGDQNPLFMAAVRLIESTIAKTEEQDEKRKRIDGPSGKTPE